MVPTALAKNFSNDHFTDNVLSAGAVLTQQRLQRGENIEDVAKILCIRQAYLNAIEQEDSLALPEAVYTLGFVRSYARYLGIPEQFMVDRFKNEVLKIAEPENVSLPVSPTDQSVPSKRWVFLGAMGVMGVLFLLYRHYYNDVVVENIDQHTTTQENMNAVPEDLPQQPQPLPAPVQHALPVQTVENAGVEKQTELKDIAAAVPVEPAENAAATEPVFAKTETAAEPITPPESAVQPVAPAQKAAEVAAAPYIRIIATARSWVEIKNAKGVSILNTTLLPGQECTVPKDNDFILTTGNIGGLQFIVEGQELPALGGQGMLKRNIVLKSDYLKNFHKRPVVMPQEHTVKPVANTAVMETKPSTPFIEVMPSVIAPASSAESRNPLAYEGEI